MSEKNLDLDELLKVLGTGKDAKSYKAAKEIMGKVIATKKALSNAERKEIAAKYNLGDSTLRGVFAALRDNCLYRDTQCIKRIRGEKGEETEVADSAQLADSAPSAPKVSLEMLVSAYQNKDIPFIAEGAEEAFKETLLAATERKVLMEKEEAEKKKKEGANDANKEIPPAKTIAPSDSKGANGANGIEKPAKTGDNQPKVAVSDNEELKKDIQEMIKGAIEAYAKTQKPESKPAEIMNKDVLQEQSKLLEIGLGKPGQPPLGSSSGSATLSEEEAPIQILNYPRDMLVRRVMWFVPKIGVYYQLYYERCIQRNFQPFTFVEWANHMLMKAYELLGIELVQYRKPRPVGETFEKNYTVQEGEILE